jgi:hypothetical protein
MLPAEAICLPSSVNSLCLSMTSGVLLTDVPMEVALILHPPHGAASWLKGPGLSAHSCLVPE